jgi:hypothetical protein
VCSVLASDVVVSGIALYSGARIYVLLKEYYDYAIEIRFRTAMDHSARLVVGLPQVEPCVAINHRLRDGTYVAAVARLCVGSLFARDRDPCLGWIRSLSACRRDIRMAKVCAGLHRVMRGAYPGVCWRHVARGPVAHALHLVVLLVGSSRPCVMASERESGGCERSG